jgi:hypothetical protein
VSEKETTIMAESKQSTPRKSPRAAKREQIASAHEKASKELEGEREQIVDNQVPLRDQRDPRHPDEEYSLETGPDSPTGDRGAE